MKSDMNFGRLVRRSMALVVAVGMAIGLGAAPAQAALRGPFSVTIPFEFNAGRSILPAGEYTVREVSEGVLSMVSDNGDSILMLTRVETTGKAGEGVASLVFACYGTERFLTEVRAGWDGTLHRVPKAKSRERLAKNSGVPATSLVIAAHGR